MVDNLMETGIHKLHLTNGVVVTFMAGENGRVHILKPLFVHLQEKTTVSEAIRTYSKAWDVVGIHIDKRIAGTFKKHAWGHCDIPDLVCELVMFRSRTVTYGPEEIDGEQQAQWYVRLNKPVDEIAGAKGDDGYMTDEFVAVVCQALWDMGLQGQTGLSAYSPTGQMCVSFGFHVVGRRVIVSNRHYRDV